MGLNQNIIDAYWWLSYNYLAGDELYFFGFSRGAYTARSLVGFIRICGLLDISKVPKNDPNESDENYNNDILKVYASPFFFFFRLVLDCKADQASLSSVLLRLYAVLRIYTITSTVVMPTSRLLFSRRRTTIAKHTVTMMSSSSFWGFGIQLAP